jgi:hypothetical protein
MVLLQKDEALYEYEAVNQVLTNAIDIPVEIQGGASTFGNPCIWVMNQLCL